MARDFSKTNLSIWQDADFRGLPWPAQWAYKMFWDHPRLSYCGVVDWQPRKMLEWGVGWSPELFKLATDSLRSRHFLVVDETIEEALVRSWVRWDGLMRQPRLAVSFANAYAALGSNTVRGVVIHEMVRLREREPDLIGWSKPAVQRMFDQPAVDPRTLDVPEDPFVGGFTIDLATVSGSVSVAVGHGFRQRLGQTLPSVSGSVSVPPTTATATATSQQLHSGSASLPEGTDSAPSESRPKGRDAAGEREDVDRVCDHLAASVERRGIKRPTITKEWRQQARLLIDADGYTPDQICWLIDQCEHHEFWVKNVLAMPKLRKQADRLKLEFRGAKTTSGPASGSNDPHAWMRRRLPNEGDQS